MKSKIKPKHKIDGCGEWWDLTCDGMYDKPRIKGWYKKHFRKKMRRRVKKGYFG